jgi:hypothetical protein
VVCREWRIWDGMLVWVLMLVIFFEGMAGRLGDSESYVVVIYSYLPDPEYNFRGRNTSCHVMVSECTIHWWRISQPSERRFGRVENLRRILTYIKM